MQIPIGGRAKRVYRGRAAFGGLHSDNVTEREENQACFRNVKMANRHDPGIPLSVAGLAMN